MSEVPPKPMDLRTTGSWLIHHSGKLQQVHGAGGFDNILAAGKAAGLLSALSATQQSSLDTKRVETLARASNINKLELPGLLMLLSDRHLIEQKPTGVEMLGVTSATILQRGAEIFGSLAPTPEELASITLAEMASERPLRTTDGAEYISDTYKLTSERTGDLFAQAEAIGFVDHETHKDGQKVYFNGNLFRHGETAKVQAVLASLSVQDQALVADVEAQLKKFGCIAAADVEAILGKPLLDKLNSISMYDVSVVSNDHENIAYATRPAAFSKYGSGLIDDGLDLAKAFVSSLTYGITRSEPGRGRIRKLDLLLDKLIAGQWTNASTAIGQDYVALELKGVVQLRKGPSYGHEMKLLKTDVGEMAKRVLRSGDTSEMPLLNIPSANVTGYQGPEATRAIRRKGQAPESKKAVRDMVEVLRTGGKR